MESDCIERCTKPLHTTFCLVSFELTLTEYSRYAHTFVLSEGIAFLSRTRKENCHGSVSLRVKNGGSKKEDGEVDCRRGKKKNPNKTDF